MTRQKDSKYYPGGNYYNPPPGKQKHSTSPGGGREGVEGGCTPSPPHTLEGGGVTLLRGGGGVAALEQLGGSRGGRTGRATGRRTSSPSLRSGGGRRVRTLKNAPPKCHWPFSDPLQPPPSPAVWRNLVPLPAGRYHTHGFARREALLFWAPRLEPKATNCFRHGYHNRHKLRLSYELTPLETYQRLRAPWHVVLATSHPPAQITEEGAR